MAGFVGAISPGIMETHKRASTRFRWSWPLVAATSPNRSGRSILQTGLLLLTAGLHAAPMMSRGSLVRVLEACIEFRDRVQQEGHPNDSHRQDTRRSCTARRRAECEELADRGGVADVDEQPRQRGCRTAP